jgi:hypothetical protein
MPPRELLREQDRSPDIDRHVRRELSGVESPEAIVREARRVVHKQSHRRQTLSRREDRGCAFIVCQLGNGLDRAWRNLVCGMVDVRDNIPAVSKQAGGDNRSNTLAGSRHDGGTLTHASSVVIPRSAKQ